MSPVNHRNALSGRWGHILEASTRRWTLAVDEQILLAGFQKRPGMQPWIGEHAGKWLLGAIAALKFENLSAVQDGTLLSSRVW